MKKYIDINDPLEEVIKKIRFNYLRGGWPLKDSLLRNFSKSEITGYSVLRKILLGILLFSAGLQAAAPGTNSLIICGSSKIQPFKNLIYAVGMVETMGNTLAYNNTENAAGIFQIRQVRIDDYNRRTGNNFVMADMFDEKISEKIFLYYASLGSPYNFERIAKAWNGSGPMTELYWRRIKRYL